MTLEEPEIHDPRAVRKFLDDLQRRNSDGLLVPEELIEASRDERSPTHSHFNWDNDAAAHQYRLGQARALIRKIEVTFPDDSEEKAVPKYVSLANDRKRPKGGYRETSKVLSNAELIKELEQTAKRDIDAVLRRFEMLKALCAKVRQAAGISPATRATRAARRARTQRGAARAG